MQDHKQKLEQCRVCLNTEGGKVLMAELKAEFDDVEVWDSDPLKMAKKAANRDFYKVMIAMQDGTGEVEDE